MSGWKGGATWANTATTLSRYNFSARVAKLVTDDVVGTVLAAAGGEPRETTSPWMARLGLLELAPATHAALARYLDESAAAGADPPTRARGCAHPPAGFPRLQPEVRAMLTRRRFLQLTGGSLAAYGTSPMWLRLGPAWAEGATGGRKLVVILLAGGNDGLNTVIPYGSPAYYDARKTIAYPETEVLKLPDSTFVGLNPALAKLHGLYGAGKVAVIQGVSYDEPDLSHFGSMDVWQSGSPTHEVSTGWLGRYLDASPAGGSVVRAVAIGNSLPTALVGAEESGVAVPSFGGFTFYDGGDADTASEPYRLHETFLRCADAPMESIPAQALLSSQRKTVTAVRAINGLAGPESKPPANLADQMGMAMTLLASNLGVEIASFTFVAGSTSLNTPGQPFRVRTGDTVVWTNLDPMSHDVAFDSIEFSAYLKDPGDSAQHTFTTPGHFTYRCNQHPEFPGMQGLVFVSDAAP